MLYDWRDTDEQPFESCAGEYAVILVGDVDQLPSVGAGKVLSDILASGAVLSVRLEKIFCQAQRKHIVTNAHKINHGEIPYQTDYDSDFFKDITLADRIFVAAS